MSVRVSAVIDEDTKREFDRVCESVGVSPEGALKVFIKRVVNFNGIPFSVAAPGARGYVETIDPVTGIVSKDPSVKVMSREEVFGCMRGEFEMSDDFDEPLEDFEEYM